MNNTTSLRTALPLVGLILVGGCGGGGGGGSAPDPTVTTMSAPASAKYSDTLLVTLTGTNLDGGLAVSSPGCKSMARSTTAPNTSDASTAYYTCTASAIGTQTVTAARASDGAALKTANFSVAVPKVTIAVANGIGTYSGTMEFTLEPDKTPATVDNFLRYVKEDFYPNTVFHRVARTSGLAPWAIQAGARLSAAPARTVNPSIALEVSRGLSNMQWTVAMARTTEPNSASYQFFINLADNQSFLDPSAGNAGYAVFGRVTTGAAVATSISVAPCSALAGVTSSPDCTPDPYMVITSAIQTQ
jgi:peptidyl-prolyl cis-trans isomerase A (cyclophilin A)